MKKFLSVLLSFSLIGSSVFAADTTDKKSIITNKGITYGLMSASGVFSIAGVAALSLLFKNHHDKSKSQEKAKRQAKLQEEVKRQEEEIKRKREEEEARLRREEEAWRKREEEKARLRREEEAAKHKKEEEEARLRREEEARRKKEEEDKLRKNGGTGGFIPPMDSGVTDQNSFLEKNRAPETSVMYHGEKVPCGKHIRLSPSDFRKFLNITPGAIILFRGIHTEKPEEYCSDFSTLGLGISSNEKAVGGNFYGKRSDVGRPVYLSNDPEMSLSYALCGGSLAVYSDITDDTHCMYLASFLPSVAISGPEGIRRGNGVYTGLPAKHSEKFVLCKSYYSFKLPRGAKYLHSDQRCFADYSALKPYASPMQKAIRGLQLWLLEMGIIIVDTRGYHQDFVCQYDPVGADRLLKELGQEKTNPLAA